MHLISKSEVRDFEDLVISTQIKLDDYELYGEREFDSIHDAVSAKQFKEIVLTSIKISQDLELSSYDDEAKQKKLRLFRKSYIYFTGLKLAENIKAVLDSSTYEQDFPANLNSPADIFQVTHFARKATSIWLSLNSYNIIDATVTNKKRSGENERKSVKRLGEKKV
jgi:hypothetical protein